MNGLHLIGDLSGCRCDPQLLLDGESFRAKSLEMVAASGLTTMDATFHTFDGGGFTGTVVLAESHLAIHTWPERQGLTLDVYVCNYSADNSGKARKLFDQIVEHFQPGEIARHEVDRGGHLLMEPLNDTTGFYIKATRQLGEWQTRFQKMAIYDTPHYGKLFRLVNAVQIGIKDPGDLSHSMWSAARTFDVNVQRFTKSSRQFGFRALIDFLSRQLLFPVRQFASA